MRQPITKIIIRITDPVMTTDVWRLFDHVINQMEKLEPGQGGYLNPIVDALGRKLFRAELMKALGADRDPMEVFNRWVTVLVPEFVPMQSQMRQAATAPAQAAVVEKEKAVEAVKTVQADMKSVAAHDRMAKARAAKKHPPKVKWMEKGKVEGPTEEEKMKMALEGMEE